MAPRGSTDFATARDLNDLMKRVADGDAQAFDHVYREVAPRVLGLIVRVLRDHAQSEEVAQEVFIHLWQSAARFDASKGNALSWILTVAHRRAVDRVRASQASRDRDSRVGIRDYSPAFDSVAETVEISVADERVREALLRLTELQRQAVMLTYYGGYSTAEAAVRLAVPVGTLKTRLRDGMIRLRDELGVTTEAA